MAMPMRALVLTLLATLPLAVAAAPAAKKGPMTPVEAGLAAYLAEGADKALAAWLRGSPMENSEDALAQADALRSVESFYGPYRSHELTAEVEIGERTRTLYVVMNYDQGPLFSRFTVYRVGEDWHLVHFNFHTLAEEVWPAALLVP